MRHIKDDDRDAITAIATGVALTLFIAAIAFLIGGCGALHHHVTPPPVDLNPVRHAAANLQHTEKALSWLNIAGFAGLAVSGGLFFYSLFTGNTVLQRPAMLAAIICVSTIGLSLAGLVALPFAPYIVLVLGVVALVLGGYELYLKFFRKPKQS